VHPLHAVTLSALPAIAVVALAELPAAPLCVVVAICANSTHA